MKGLVVAPQPIACEAGRWAFERGGNAIDAAIATAFAQAVVDPFNAGPGGFGTMHLWIAETGDDVIIDFHGRIGSRAHPSVFENDVLGQIDGHAERYAVRDYANQVGYRAVTVPGMVKGLGLAAKRYGRLGWAELLQPAIGLAREGFIVYGELYRSWTEPTEAGHLDTLTRAQATKPCSAIFTREGRLPRAGEVLVQPDLARTLESLARDGPESFYRGELARRIAEDFRDNGAFVTAEDLASYEAEVRTPVVGTYRGYRVSSAPPPCSGVQIIEILNILEGWDLGAMDPTSADYVHRWIQTQRYSFVDRSGYLGDPAFVDVPVGMLISKEYAAQVRRRIEAGERAVVPKVGAAEAEHTTQVTTLDASGNAVSLTQTLGTSAGVVTPGLGFMCNNAMYQFNPLPGSPNSIEPGKRRITGISPTLVFRDGRLRMALGAPGGTRILTAIATAIVNVIDHGMTAVEAVSAPRIYCDGPVARIEPRLYHGVRAALEARGERLACSEFSWDPFFSHVQMVLIEPETGRVTGASDPRAGGGVVVAR